MPCVVLQAPDAILDRLLCDPKEAELRSIVATYVTAEMTTPVDKRGDSAVKASDFVLGILGVPLPGGHHTVGGTAAAAPSTSHPAGSAAPVVATTAAVKAEGEGEGGDDKPAGSVGGDVGDGPADDGGNDDGARKRARVA